MRNNSWRREMSVPLVSGLLMPKRPSATEKSACNWAMVPARPESPSVLTVACGLPPERSPSARELTIFEITAWPWVEPSRPVS